MHPDWLTKYPRAAALLQDAEDVLHYDPDPDPEDNGLTVAEIRHIVAAAALMLKHHLRMGWKYPRPSDPAVARGGATAEAHRPADDEADAPFLGFSQETVDAARILINTLRIAEEEG
jgi:hypothetical protein